MKLKGKYLVTVTATDTGGLFTNTELEVRILNGTMQPDWPSANTCFTPLQIFTVDESYKVELEFTSSEQEVEEKLNEIIKFVTFGSLKI